MILLFLLITFGWPGDTIIESSIVPDIEFDREIFDFGSVYEGDPVRYTFIFRNIGDAPLKITNVRTSCGCTVADRPKKEILPDSFGEIKVVFRTKGFKGKSSKYVFVHSNDPDEKTVRLELTGIVKVEFRIEPSQIVFGNIVEGTSPFKKLEIIPEALTNLEIKKIESSSQYFSLSKKRTKKDNKFIFEITVRINKNAPIGGFVERIKVHTNSERQPIVEIPVVGTIIPKTQ